jgi:hypothetical protein
MNIFSDIYDVISILVLIFGCLFIFERFEWIFFEARENERPLLSKNSYWGVFVYFFVILLLFFLFLSLATRMGISIGEDY